MLPLDQIEAAIAAEAAAHTAAAAELNPYAEAETLELGRANAVYSGAISPVHGVYALGLDGPPEERDWREIERFFHRKERAATYWITPFTDPAVVETIRETHRPTLKQAVRGELLTSSSDPLDPFTGPNLDAWSKAFGDAAAFTKIHQRGTRFYLTSGAASYTFFHQGIALIPVPRKETFAEQRNENFHSKALVVMGDLKSIAAAGGSDLPLLYERVLYEPI